MKILDLCYAPRRCLKMRMKVGVQHKELHPLGSSATPTDTVDASSHHRTERALQRLIVGHLQDGYDVWEPSTLKGLLLAAVVGQTIRRSMSG